MGHEGQLNNLLNDCCGYLACVFTGNRFYRASISVGSPQVSFLMCTLEIPQKNCSTSSLLLTLFTFTFEPFLKL